MFNICSIEDVAIGFFFLGFSGCSLRIKLTCDILESGELELATPSHHSYSVFKIGGKHPRQNVVTLVSFSDFILRNGIRKFRNWIKVVSFGNVVELRIAELLWICNFRCFKICASLEISDSGFRLYLNSNPARTFLFLQALTTVHKQARHCVGCFKVERVDIYIASHKTSFWD